ncbi:MAG: ATP-binding protein [Acidobacteria bacterium]|nr:ATP-binding protein [Acidobacteriota bacterium]
MQGAEFRGLAEAVTRSYGDDPWFFLRELAQNSRDAGARNIWVSAEATAGMETLSFVDDGKGLTLEHARRFLFRLFASDKGHDQAAAGRYGIGFWTVLRFQPTAIHIQSRRGRDSWALAFDADLQARPLPCGLNRRGTAITLIRPASGASTASAPGFAAELKNGLRTYCRYLRRNDRKASMLPLWFAGENLVEPMALPGPLSLSFRSGSLEGAVGLGEKPLVRLYARGLPVWEGTLLSQMSHLQVNADLRAEVASGLAPVFLLNGNQLDVTFSRHLTVENRELERVRRKAEKARQRLLAVSLATAFPCPWPRRWWGRLRAAGAHWRRPGRHWLPLALLILLILEFTALRLCFSGRSERAPDWFSLRAAPLSYRGARVAAAPAAALPPFSYRPEAPVLFKLFTASDYDEESGFVRRPGGARRLLASTMACPETAAMNMRLQSEAGETFLPLAPGHALVSGSLRLNGRPLAASFATETGEAAAELPSAGNLEYRSCPGPRESELSAGDFSRFTRLPPGTILPADLEAAAAAARSLPVRERLERSLSWVGTRLRYDASPAVAELYRSRGPSEPWAFRVLGVGRGDCDVLNGFMVLLLRKMNVPARLVVGMIGDRGGVRGVLHAWCEYFDQGWAIRDATAIDSAPATIPAAQDEASPLAGRPDSQRTMANLWTFGLVFLSLAAVGLLVFLRKSSRDRKASSWFFSGDIADPLLKIAQQALLQPSAWGEDSPIWRHPILPVLGGGAISLERAQRLQRKKELFVTVNRNPLAASLARAGITVLDLGSPLHAPLLALLANAVDADRLCRLRPQLPPPNGLLAELNALGRGWRKAPLFLLAPGLSGAEILPVSLPASLSAPPFYFPRRFIAVHPLDRQLTQGSSLYPHNRALAVLRFLQGMDNGPLPDPPFSKAYVRRIARRLLRSSHD